MNPKPTMKLLLLLSLMSPGLLHLATDCRSFNTTIPVINVSADFLAYDMTNPFIVAAGNVVIQFGDVTIESERLNVDLIDWKLRACENKILYRNKIWKNVSLLILSIKDMIGYYESFDQTIEKAFIDFGDMNITDEKITLPDAPFQSKYDIRKSNMYVIAQQAAFHPYLKIKLHYARIIIEGSESPLLNKISLRIGNQEPRKGFLFNSIRLSDSGYGNASLSYRYMLSDRFFGGITSSYIRGKSDYPYEKKHAGHFALFSNYQFDENRLTKIETAYGTYDEALISATYRCSSRQRENDLSLKASWQKDRYGVQTKKFSCYHDRSLSDKNHLDWGGDYSFDRGYKAGIRFKRQWNRRLSSSLAFEYILQKEPELTEKYKTGTTSLDFIWRPEGLSFELEYFYERVFNMHFARHAPSFSLIRPPRKIGDTFIHYSWRNNFFYSHEKNENSVSSYHDTSLFMLEHTPIALTERLKCAVAVVGGLLLRTGSADYATLEYRSELEHDLFCKFKGSLIYYYYTRRLTESPGLTAGNADQEAALNLNRNTSGNSFESFLFWDPQENRLKTGAASFSLKWKKFWKTTVKAGYDFISEEVIDIEAVIVRDLHINELRLKWRQADNEFMIELIGRTF